ncbi:MAG TPA: hypothetical protein VF155_04020 [Candidatus Dormibacteraeota bacterium]
MVSEPLLSFAGVVAAVVAMMVDVRGATLIAVVAVTAGLAPTVALTGGGTAVLVLAVAAAAGVGGGLLGHLAARRLPWVAGLDPRVPAFAPSRQLFGPRSARAFAAALAIPIASWVSFNVPIGEVAVVQGVLFPIAYVWGCGLLRMVVGRTVADLTVGVTMIALAAAAAWLVRGGPDALAGAAAAASLAPLAAIVSGWLSGRHARRAAPVADPGT